MAKAHIEAEVTIDRPIADVFRFVAVDHCENNPTWDPNVVRIEPPGEGAMELGSRFTIVRTTMGREESRVFEVRQWDEPARMTITTRSKDFDLSLVSGGEALGAARTHLTLAADVRVGGIRALLTPLMKRKFATEIRRNLMRIKRTLETPALTVTQQPDSVVEAR